MKLKTSVEGMGVAVSGYEEDYLELDTDEGDGQLIYASELLDRTGGEVISDAALEDFRHEGMKAWGEIAFAEHYRRSTGRAYPRVYRIKVVLEAEELPEAEARAWWSRRNLGDEKGGDQ